MTGVEVIRAGPLTTVQDRGRPGWAHIGVPPAGPADPRALGLATRIVGNPPDAAGLEATLAGPTLRFAATAEVAVVGAAATVSIGGRAASTGALLTLEVGQGLEIG